MEPGSSLTNIRLMKPVLKQFLIKVPAGGVTTPALSHDSGELGIKASEVDLEKLKCEKCSFQAFYQPPGTLPGESLPVL